METAFFAGFADEMQKLAAPLSQSKLRTLQIVLGGLGMGVVGGVTEGVVGSLTNAAIEKHTRRKEKK